MPKFRSRQPGKSEQQKVDEFQKSLEAFNDAASQALTDFAEKMTEVGKMFERATESARKAKEAEDRAKASATEAHRTSRKLMTKKGHW